MNAETKIALLLLAMLGAGLLLIAAGLGWNTKPAALGVGIALSLAATRLLAAGPHR